MKNLLNTLALLVLVSNSAIAFNCDTARQEFQLFLDYKKYIDLTINTKNNDIQRLEARIRDNNVKTDSEIDGFDKQYNITGGEWNITNQAVKKLSKQCLDDKLELDQGLFCSKCLRPRSAVERETGHKFEYHLEDVKSKAIRAPQEAYDRLRDKCNSKHKELLVKEKNYRKDMDNIMDKKSRVADSNLKSNVQIRSRITEINRDISELKREASPKMIQGLIAEREMRENGCFR